MASTDPGAHEQLEAAEQAAVIAKAVNRLSVEQRIAFLLREVDGMSYNEIAQITGLSLSAVKSRIYRARNDLARTLRSP